MSVSPTSSRHGRTLYRSQGGASLLEYLVAVCLVAVATISVAKGLGENITALLKQSTGQLEEARKGARTDDAGQATAGPNRPLDITSIDAFTEFQTGEAATADERAASVASAKPRALAAKPPSVSLVGSVGAAAIAGRGVAGGTGWLATTLTWGRNLLGAANPVGLAVLGIAFVTQPFGSGPAAVQTGTTFGKLAAYHHDGPAGRLTLTSESGIRLEGSINKEGHFIFRHPEWDTDIMIAHVGPTGGIVASGNAQRLLGISRNEAGDFIKGATRGTRQEIEEYKTNATPQIDPPDISLATPQTDVRTETEGYAQADVERPEPAAAPDLTDIDTAILTSDARPRFDLTGDGRRRIEGTDGARILSGIPAADVEARRTANSNNAIRDTHSFGTEPQYPGIGGEIGDQSLITRRRDGEHEVELRVIYDPRERAAIVEATNALEESELSGGILISPVNVTSDGTMWTRRPLPPSNAPRRNYRELSQSERVEVAEPLIRQHLQEIGRFLEASDLAEVEGYRIHANTERDLYWFDASGRPTVKRVAVSAVPTGSAPPERPRARSRSPNLRVVE